MRLRSPILSARSSLLAGTAALLAILALGACSGGEPAGDPGKATADGGNGGKDGVIFQPSDTTFDVPGQGTDAEGPADDACTGAGRFDPACQDAAADTADAPVSGTFGAPCTTVDDCDSALCIPSPQGSICTKTCVDECPDGFKCVAKESAGGDFTYLCAPAFGTLCDPCSSSADCNSLGEVDNVCLSFGAEGSFCGAVCGPGKAACPSGYSCQAGVDPASGKTVKQCVFDGGLCPCSPKAAAKGLATACVNKNLYGACKGTRQCTAGGLTDCQAQVPAPEECNGQDDDCNGQIDDFDITAKCKKSNAFGTCEGVLTACQDGVPKCDAPEAKPEACNGLDDDCDGQTDEDLCEDGSACTKDTCNTDGSCQHQPLSGPACDDGNNCTEKDKCSQGTCTGGAPLGCDDGDPCTVDGCDALGGCVHTPQDGPCTDDGNACTQDVCIAGKCSHPAKAAGEACLEDGDPCTQDVCSSGQCAHPPVKDGTACLDDGNPCTGDVCGGGKCGHPPVAFTVTCAEDGNPCTADVCDKGGCTHQALGSNVSCLEDGDPCTQDLCLNGKCSHPAAVNDTPCADDGLACTDDVCISGKCSHPGLDGQGCVDDGNPCTSDLCSAGKCAHPAKDNIACADDGNECTNDLCKGGNCSHVYNNSGCTDGDPCTLIDKCNLGLCKGYNAKACDDGNPCTNDKCQAGQGCVYTPNNNIVCNDGNGCTTNDLCTNSVCAGSSTKSCNDGNPCTSDNCEGGGCQYVNNTAACADDGNVCTDDKCSNGACLHPAKAAGAACADDGNPCTDGQCQNGLCKQVAADNVCNDGNACTSNDKCVGGVCSGTAFKNCDDGNPCTQDSCDKFGTCTHSATGGASCKAPSGECPIGVCQGGSCVSKSGETCQAEYDVDLCSSVKVPGTCSGSGKCVASSAPPGYTCPGCNGICIKCLIFQFCLAF